MLLLFKLTTKVLLFKSIITFSTSGIAFNCLLIALEHIEQVKPVAIISTFDICAKEFVIANNIAKTIHCFFIIAIFIFYIFLTNYSFKQKKHSSLKTVVDILLTNYFLFVSKAFLSY